MLFEKNEINSAINAVKRDKTTGINGLPTKLLLAAPTSLNPGNLKPFSIWKGMIYQIPKKGTVLDKIVGEGYLLAFWRDKYNSLNKAGT